MARLTVELEERELARLRSAARARQIDPSHMTTMQLVQVLTDAQPKKKTSWLAGGAARAQRLAAVMSMHGIWKDDPTKPQDGAEYQREVRAEWR